MAYKSISVVNWNNVPKGFEGIIKFIESNHILYVKSNRSLHRLDGPASIDSLSGYKSYYINDVYYYEQDYWNHWLVIKHKLEKILEL